MSHRACNFADLLSDSARSFCRRSATLSTIFGCVSEVMIDSNTIIILYLLALGGSGSFSMISTAMTGLAYLFLAIPAAGFAARFGLRLTYTSAAYAATGSLLLMAAAPFFGHTAARYIVIGTCLIYGLSRPVYVSTWYPICDGFLKKDERGSFFGSMRFTYMTINSLLLFLIGLFLGSHTPMWIFQLAVAFAGVCMLGRKICLDRLPVDPRLEKTEIHIREALNISLHNLPLLGYGFYIMVLNFAVMAAFPLAVLFMRLYLNFTPFAIMLITAIGQAGFMAGYAVFIYCAKRWSTNTLSIVTHLLYLLMLTIPLFVFTETPCIHFLMASVLFLNGVANAFLNCCCSLQMMALARPGNKVMAMSVLSTFQNSGIFAGRMLVTGILAAGVLVTNWNLGPFSLTHYHTIFLGEWLLAAAGLLFLLLGTQKPDNSKI